MHLRSFCKRSILGCHTHLETESAYPVAEVKALKYCRKWLEQAILHYMQKQLRIRISMILLRIEISVLDFHNHHAAYCIAKTNMTS